MDFYRVAKIICEAEEGLDRLTALYDTWGQPIQTQKDFDLFLGLAKHDLGMGDEEVKQVFRDALVAGIIDASLGKFLAPGDQLKESIVNEQEPPKEGIKPEVGGIDSPKPEIAKPDGVADEKGKETPDGSMPPEDATEDTEEQLKAAQLPEKEYLGTSQDTHYYVVRSSNDTGDISDVIIEDQTEDKLWSAKEKGIDFMDMKSLIKAAVDDLDMEMVSTDIIVKYELLEEPVEEETEEIDTSIPPAESNPGDVGGSPLEALTPKIKNESRINEDSDGLEKVLAGAGVVKRWWWMPGKDLVVAGINDDQANSIASQLNGKVAGTTIQDGRKCYRVVFESIQEGKLLASSSSEDGIKKLISEYYGGSTVNLVPDGENKWGVKTGRSMNSIQNIRVSLFKGKYRFERVEEGRTNKEMSISLLNYIRDNAPMNKNLDQVSKEIRMSKVQGNYNQEMALDKVLSIVKEGAVNAYKVERDLIPSKDIFPSENILRETAVSLLQTIGERINEDYEILAADISDEQTAKDIASQKQGYSIADPKDPKKFLVVKDKENNSSSSASSLVS